jgi:hypothetical protein
MKWRTRRTGLDKEEENQAEGKKKKRTGLKFEDARVACSPIVGSFRSKN